MDVLTSQVSSLEKELSLSRTKYADHIQKLEEQVRQVSQVTKHKEEDWSQDTLIRIEKQIASVGEMMKVQAQEGREACKPSVEQNEQIWKLQMEKQELEMKLRMAGEAMHEYVVKLSEKVTVEKTF